MGRQNVTGICLNVCVSSDGNNTMRGNRIGLLNGVLCFNQKRLLWEVNLTRDPYEMSNLTRQLSGERHSKKRTDHAEALWEIFCRILVTAQTSFHGVFYCVMKLSPLIQDSFLNIYSIFKPSILWEVMIIWIILKQVQCF